MRKLQKTLALLLTATLLLSGTVFAAPETEAYELSALEEAEKPSIRAEKQVTALPNANFVADRLLVKVERRPALLGSDDLFAGLADNVSRMFSVTEPAPDGEVMLAGAEEPTADWFRVDLAAGVDMLEAWNQLLAEDAVLYVEPDYIAEPAAAYEITNQDPYLPSQTWLDEIRAPEAWGMVGGAPGKDVIVAVIDTGVDLDHPDLEGQLVPGYDFVAYEDGWDNDPNDESGHGTHVAGIIAAKKNDIGVRGVAYNAKIMPVRILGENGGEDSGIAAAIRWAAGAADVRDANGNLVPAAAKKADIFNMSFRGFSYSQVIADAVAYARQQGCLLVAAAGNDSMPTTFAGDAYFGAYVSPANLPDVLTVMASNQNVPKNENWLAFFSNYDADPGNGAEYEIMAPGMNICSTYMDGTYCYLDGTSMASPVVAGAAAVLMGMGCTADEAWELLVAASPRKPGIAVTRQGEDCSWEETLEYPALDLASAVYAAKNGGVNYGPQIANCYLSASLPNLDLGHGTVDFSGLNTQNYVYYHNGQMKSDLELIFENFGGSGQLVFTGTVGGCAIQSVTVNIDPGEVVTVPLRYTGNPRMDEYGQVVVELAAADAHGTFRMGMGIWAAELKTPAMMSNAFGIGQLGDGEGNVNDCYVVRNSSVTLEGFDNCDIVWVMDLSVVIQPGTALEIIRKRNQGSVSVYMNTETCFLNQKDEGEGGAEGRLSLDGVTVLSADLSRFIGYGNTELLGCDIYDAYIAWASVIFRCRLESTRYAMTVNADIIEESGIAQSIKWKISCREFRHNLVNRCSESTLTVSQRAKNNTFVENYVSGHEDSVLQVYVPDFYHSEETGTVGFVENCVVGPLKVYQNGSNAEPARVERVYQQCADETVGFSEALVCAEDSIVSGYPDQLQQWGFAHKCPVFILGQNCSVEPGYNGYEAIMYTIDYRFSTPIDPEIGEWGVSFASNQDPMTANAQREFLIDEESKNIVGIRIRQATVITRDEMAHDYHLGGIYSAPVQEGENNYLYFGKTALAAQRMTATADLRGNSSVQLQTEMSNGNLEISWLDDRIQSEDIVKLSRSVDRGEMVPLVNVMGWSSYTDMNMQSGHVYDYSLRVIRNEEEVYWGEITFVYPHKINNHEPLELTVNEGGTAVTVGIGSAWLTGESTRLTYNLPEDMAAQINFAPQVRNSRLVYGAVNNGDGTVTVTIGEPDQEEILLPGELFTVTAKNGAVCSLVGKDILCRNGSADLGLWHLSDTNTATLAAYQGGKLAGVGVAGGWNQACTVRTAGADSWKVFHTNAAWQPVQAAQPIS